MEEGREGSLAGEGCRDRRSWDCDREHADDTPEEEACVGDAAVGRGFADRNLEKRSVFMREGKRVEK